LLSQSL